MARIQVMVPANGLTASVRVTAGPPADADALRQALRAAGVRQGIDATACADVAARLRDREARFDAVVARGTPPTAGENGRLEGELLAPPRPGRRSASGDIDYRERDVVHPVAAGDCIATLVPPTAGTPGVDVRGRVLPATPGKPARHRLKDGVRLEGSRVIAARNGVLAFTDTTIDVVELYTHPADVDYASGNLHSGGSLLIQGDIDDGFEATADGDVNVTGTVFGAVRAGGSVHVQQGVLGSQQAVRAGLDLTCHHATATRLIAGRTLLVRDQASQSLLKAHEVLLLDGHACVRGGEVRTRERIDVGTAGATAGTPTVLATAQLLDERQELARRTAATNRAGRLGKGALHRHRGGKLARGATRAGDEERAEKLRLKRRQRELLDKAQVRIPGPCHAGVLVRFADLEYRVDEDRVGVTFRYDRTSDAIVPMETT